MLLKIALTLDIELGIAVYLTLMDSKTKIK